MPIAAPHADEGADPPALVEDEAGIARQRLPLIGRPVHVGQRRRVNRGPCPHGERGDFVSGRRVGGDGEEVAAHASREKHARSDAPFLLGKERNVLERGIRHAHGPGHRCRAQRHWRREHHRRRATRPRDHLPHHRRGRRREPTVAAAIAIEGQPGRDAVMRGRHNHGLQVDPRRPDALLGFRHHVEAHHGNRKEGDGRRCRELHGQRVAQQPLGALVVGGGRHVRQPGRHGLRFVPHRGAVEVAEWQAGGVEEVRRIKVGEPDVVHPAPLILEPQGASLGQLDEAGRRDKVARGLRIDDGVVGAHIRRVERIGERAQAKPEVVVNRVAPRELAAGEERARVFGGQRTGPVAAELLGTGLHAQRHARGGEADGPRPAPAIFIAAVEAVQSVEPPQRRRERRLVGDDVDGAGQRVRSVHERARAVDHLHAGDGIRGDQAHFGTGAIRRLAGRIEPLAIDEHQEPRRVEATQPRPHAEGTVADGGDVGGQRQRIAGGCLVGLRDALGPDRLDMQRNLPRITLRPRGRHHDGRRQPGDLQRQRHLDIAGRRLDHHSPRGLGKSGPQRRHQILARSGHAHVIAPVGPGGDFDHLAGGHVAHRHPDIRQWRARRVGHHALQRFGTGRRGRAHSQPQHHHTHLHPCTHDSLLLHRRGARPVSGRTCHGQWLSHPCNNDSRRPQRPWRHTLARAHGTDRQTKTMAGTEDWGGGRGTARSESQGVRSSRTLRGATARDSVGRGHRCTRRSSRARPSPSTDEAAAISTRAVTASGRPASV